VALGGSMAVTWRWRERTSLSLCALAFFELYNSVRNPQSFASIPKILYTDDRVTDIPNSSWARGDSRPRERLGIENGRTAEHNLKCTLLYYTFSCLAFLPFGPSNALCIANTGFISTPLPSDFPPRVFLSFRDPKR